MDIILHTTIPESFSAVKTNKADSLQIDDRVQAGDIQQQTHIVEFVFFENEKRLGRLLFRIHDNPEAFAQVHDFFHKPQPNVECEILETEAPGNYTVPLAMISKAIAILQQADVVLSCILVANRGNTDEEKAANTITERFIENSTQWRFVPIVLLAKHKVKKVEVQDGDSKP